MGVPYLPFGELSGDWSDQPLYIIGGGRSLLGFDFTRLEGRTLGANKSAFHADTDVLCSIDQHFVRSYRKRIVEFLEQGREVVLVMPPSEDGHQPIPGATYVTRIRGEGLSEKPDRVHGPHTGVGCIGLAYLMGAKDIRLLGFDMQVGEHGTHFHGGYSWQNKAVGKHLHRWALHFDRVARQLEAAGCQVTNFIGEPESRITAFPTRPLSEL